MILLHCNHRIASIRHSSLVAQGAAPVNVYDLDETSMTKNSGKIIPVILCGGSGTRLWPASREKHPKQFLSLMNDFSLLQNTARRALRVSGADASSLVVVTLEAMKEGVKTQLAELDDAATRHILGEPSARNTAAAVAMAADYVSKTFGEDAILWVLPADHHIEREEALAASFAHAIAALGNRLATFGISPSRPDTEYGYIRVGDSENDFVYKAERFVEKPDAVTAQSYLDEGNYLWNSGMFLFSAGEVLRHYDEHAADILSAVRGAISNGENGAPCAKTYAGVPSQPFDKAIMEQSDRVLVVPCNPEWSDVGSWESLWELRPKDKNGNAVDGRAALVNARDCLVQSKDRLVAIAGVDNIVVIETEDALLIAGKSDGDSMKALVRGLKDSGAREAIEKPQPPQPAQPWTMVKSLGGEQKLGAREIMIAAGDKKTFHARGDGLCLYTVLEGTATIQTGDSIRKLDTFQSMDIHASGDYTITNRGASPLRLIEVQKDVQEGIFFGKQTTGTDSKKVA